MTNFEARLLAVWPAARARPGGGAGRLRRAIQSRRKVRIGWLTPMLGALVALDLTSFWMVALVGAGAGSRALCQPARGADRDGSLLPRRAHHLSLRPRRMARLRRPVFRAPPVGAGGCHAVQPHRHRRIAGAGRGAAGGGAVNRWSLLLFIPALGAAMFAPGRRISLTLLLLLVVQYPLVAVLGYAGVGR